MNRELPVHVQARRDDFLAAVHRRAAQLRRRRKAVAMAPVVAVLGAVAFAFATTRSIGPRPRVAVLDQVATSTTARTGTTTASTTKPRGTTTKPTTTTTFVLPPLPIPPTTSPPTTAAPVTVATTAPVTTTPATTTPVTAPPVCRDSFDPRCGAFRWEPPPPANRGLSVSLAVSDTAPAAGTAVSFTVDLGDADAAPQCASASIGGRRVPLTDASGQPVRSCVVRVCAQGPVRYGPWTPPAPSGGSRRVFGTFVAQGRGAQDLAVVASSGSGGACPYDPYGSTAGRSATITVR